MRRLLRSLLASKASLSSCSREETSSLRVCRGSSSGIGEIAGMEEKRELRGRAAAGGESREDVGLRVGELLAELETELAVLESGEVDMLCTVLASRLRSAWSNSIDSSGQGSSRAAGIALDG